MPDLSPRQTTMLGFTEAIPSKAHRGRHGRTLVLLKLVAHAMVALTPRLAAAGQYVPLTEKTACGLPDLVFIGTVTAMEPYIHRSSYGEIVASSVTFRVERTIAGQHRSDVELDIRGGVYGERKDHGWFHWEIGDRQMLLVNFGPGVSPRFGDNAIRYAFDLPNDVVLPPESILQAAWREHCGHHDHALPHGRESDPRTLPLDPAELPQGSTSEPERHHLPRETGRAPDSSHEKSAARGTGAAPPNNWSASAELSGHLNDVALDRLRHYCAHSFAWTRVSGQRSESVEVNK